MNNFKSLILVIVLSASATNAHAVSYECEVDGQVVYQPRPCDGVAYPENLTQESRYGGTNMSLTDLLAARGAVRESQHNAAKQNKRHNRATGKEKFKSSDEESEE